jgi:hypothetical protein
VTHFALDELRSAGLTGAFDEFPIARRTRTEVPLLDDSDNLRYRLHGPLAAASGRCESGGQ